ncbi:maleylpyruvate isomerase family mycothiol-dependent enzyme [Kineosporia sp. R_H_3]|uniref:maleylpyruvate isomerase family mycothiol-dependent enzyme n=1 Tax=Kineosporia sp. R_H_3 TaxID=1961848 RepID=UPI0013046760|nr:maleylpyruvate isomerase family mycothiol-dependent enzyme [Kineosporia sp. R_H_3]
MDTTPSPDLVRAALAEQTLALAAEAATLTSADLAAPSALPGWTRGHVLAHVRLNAEAFVGVLGAAARGEVVSMYPGRAERDAAIEAAASEPADRQTAALLDSAARFTRAWAALPPQRYDVEFTSPAGWFQPAGVIGFFRWREVVLHQADLQPADAGRRSAVDVLAGAEPALVARLLAETCATFAGRADVPPLVVTSTDLGTTWEIGAAPAATAVSGTAAALAAWLTGRGSGTGLTSSGPLPDLPAFA